MKLFGFFYVFFGLVFAQEKITIECDVVSHGDIFKVKNILIPQILSETDPFPVNLWINLTESNKNVDSYRCLQATCIYQQGITKELMTQISLDPGMELWRGLNQIRQSLESGGMWFVWHEYFDDIIQKRKVNDKIGFYSIGCLYLTSNDPGACDPLATMDVIKIQTYMDVHSLEPAKTKGKMFDDSFSQPQCMIS